MYILIYLVPRTYAFRKANHNAAYHFTIFRASPDSDVFQIFPSDK